MNLKEEILQEILVEAERASELWGNEFDNKNTASDWADYIYLNVSLATDYHMKPFNGTVFDQKMIKAAGLILNAIYQRRTKGFPKRNWED